MMITYKKELVKTELEIQKMQAAGSLNALALEEVKK